MPPFQRFIDPLLRFLVARGGEVAVSTVYEAVADELKLSPDDRALMLPSRQQPVYRNRIGWAHDRIKRRGWSSSPRRGMWRVTDEGRRVAGAHPRGLPDELIDEIARVERGGRVAPGEPLVQDDSPIIESPEELIEAGIAQLTESAARDLLERIGRGTPRFFEVLVLDLLHAMGYGATRADLEHAGGSGDGGIDGVISLDRLGLEKVFVQAKRWQGRVGRPAIQGFYGALAGRRATKGVFITTSDFTDDAIEFADKVERIVLVDGARLGALMIEHGVGVQHKTLRVPKVDGDYFDEE